MNDLGRMLDLINKSKMDGIKEILIFGERAWRDIEGELMAYNNYTDTKGFKKSKIVVMVEGYLEKYKELKKEAFKTIEVNAQSLEEY